MSAHVEPALTADEWRARRVVRIEPFRLTTVILEEDGIGVSARFEGDGAAVYVDGESRRALAALALAGRDYGFTVNDVRAIHQAAAALGHLGTPANRLTAPIISLARRLAALVPPEPYD